MKAHHKYLGLDVHKERNEVAIADSTGEARVNEAIPTEAGDGQLRAAKTGGLSRRNPFWSLTWLSCR